MIGSTAWGAPGACPWRRLARAWGNRKALASQRGNAEQEGAGKSEGPTQDRSSSSSFMHGAHRERRSRLILAPLRQKA